MNLFLENIIRYPKFLITSISGLVIILLSPLSKFAKKGIKNKLFLLLFLSLALSFFNFLLTLMLNL
jgi:hypothetical protein